MPDNLLAKPVIYQKAVYIFISRDRVSLRFPTGIKASKLNQSGLLNKSEQNFEAKNIKIREKLNEVQQANDNYPDLSAKELALYIRKGILPNSPDQEPEVKQYTFLECFEKFIKDSETGIRKTPKKSEISSSTIKGYRTVLTNLKKFSVVYDLSQWQNINDKFYNQFCKYSWETLNHFDNHVGKSITIIKTALNYAYDAEWILNPIKTKNWHSWKEDINILVLYQDELKLIKDMPLNSPKLDRTRDIFLMGTFTCLRVENLLKLTKQNLMSIKGETYINTIVTKTQEPIKTLLNPMAVQIIEKYNNQYITLLPTITDVKFNENLKELAAEFAKYLKEMKESKKLDISGNDWESDFQRKRTKQGKTRYNGKDLFEYVKPQDIISSHCMRRTGITYLLSAGMVREEVSAISGHSLNSRDFNRYVKISEERIGKKAIAAWSSLN